MDENLLQKQFWFQNCRDTFLVKINSFFPKAIWCCGQEFLHKHLWFQNCRDKFFFKNPQTLPLFLTYERDLLYLLFQKFRSQDKPLPWYFKLWTRICFTNSFGFKIVETNLFFCTFLSCGREFCSPTISKLSIERTNLLFSWGYFIQNSASW